MRVGAAVIPGAWGLLVSAAGRGWDAVEAVYRSLEPFDLHRDLLTHARDRVRALDARSIIADPAPFLVEESLPFTNGTQQRWGQRGLDY